MMRGGALFTVMMLAACSGGRDESASAPSPTPTVAAPRTLVAADFDATKLGAHVAGFDITDAPVGPAKAGLAAISGFVACPKDVAGCDPKTLPAGTIYTYVLTLTPVVSPEDKPQPTAMAPSTAMAARETPAELVRMLLPANAFNGAVGFSQAEAEAALGKPEAMSVTLDSGRLIWRVTGGTGWQPGKPITLWWQSTLPPATAKAAYRLEFRGKPADISAPFPVQKPVERAPAR